MIMTLTITSQIGADFTADLDQLICHDCIAFTKCHFGNEVIKIIDRLLNLSTCFNIRVLEFITNESALRARRVQDLIAFPFP